MENLSLLYIVLPILLIVLIMIANEYKNNWYINFIVSQIVQIVEQEKQKGTFDDKKDEAIKRVKILLEKVHIYISESEIDILIEKWVWELYNQFKSQKIDLT